LKLEGAIPAMPVRDAGAAAAFYRDRIGFTVVHQEDGFAILRPRWRRGAPLAGGR